MQVANPIQQVTQIVEAEHLLLNWQVMSGRCVDAGEVARVYSSKAQLLQAEGRHLQALSLLHEAIAYLAGREDSNHPDTLLLREMAAASQLAVGDPAGALSELDLLYKQWANIGDTDGMARAKFYSLDHYATSGQYKLAWQTFSSHAELFDVSAFPSMTLFINCLIQVADKLGKGDAVVMLTNWLALIEDVEWEPDPVKQKSNLAWFENFRNSVGGLQGLLGLRSGALC